MITNSELDNIIEVLSSPDGTLEDCFSKFTKFFPQDQFRACCVLINLMNSNVIPKILLKLKTLDYRSHSQNNRHLFDSRIFQARESQNQPFQHEYNRNI